VEAARSLVAALDDLDECRLTDAQGAGAVCHDETGPSDAVGATSRPTFSMRREVAQMEDWLSARLAHAAASRPHVRTFSANDGRWGLATGPTSPRC
jgi:hypothetical protein